MKFAKGQGVANDEAYAVRLYHLAAAQGHAIAQNNLGVMFEFDRGVSKDNAEAVRLYRLSAAQGHAFWWSRKQTSLREPGASAFPPLTIFHSLMPCRSGKTALALAIKSNQKHVAAYLTSIGAPEY